MTTLPPSLLVLLYLHLVLMIGSRSLVIPPTNMSLKRMLMSSSSLKTPSVLLIFGVNLLFTKLLTLLMLQLLHPLLCNSGSPLQRETLLL